MKLSLGKKLMGSFLIVTILLLVVAYFGISTISTDQKDYGRIVKVNLPVGKYVWQIRADFLEKVAAMRGYMVYKDDKYIQIFEDAVKQQNKDADEVAKLLQTEESRQYLAKLKDIDEKYNEIARQIFAAIKAGDMAKSTSFAADARQVVNDFKALSLEWDTWVNQLNEEIVQKVVTSAERSENISYAVSLAAVVTSVILGLYISRAITKPVNQIVAMLKDMAESGGDLTQRISVSVKDEIGDLAHWFNAFLDKLHDVIAQVRQSSDMVASAANETSLGNQDLSQRTEEQASALQEISSTIEEVTASLQKSSESANDADGNSRATLETVRKGETVVNELNRAMEEITRGSHEIAEIIAKVNDIAFQTNLLALNAAVEAARAGEQGRGFAVVAAEVRNLAGRTAESAKEIEGLIKESIVKVERGNELMGETAAVLNEIVDNTQRTTDVIIEIASTMREQSNAADDIRTAVEQLNQVTQQNASLVEEIAGSSESVSNEAEELTALVSKFKLQMNSYTHSREAKPETPKAPAGRVRPLIPQTAQPLIAATHSTARAQYDEGDFEKF